MNYSTGIDRNIGEAFGRAALIIVYMCRSGRRVHKIDVNLYINKLYSICSLCVYDTLRS